MPKILLLEDDRTLAESLVEYLEFEDFEVTWLSDERLLEDLDLHAFDLLILDLILTHKPGELILKEIRGQGIEVPILIITAKHKIRDKETCFQNGADDYLTKPFNPKELALRLKSLLKRTPPTQNLTIGELEIDLNHKRVLKAGQEMNLTRRTLDLLLLLAQQRGKMVSKEQMLAIVWSDAVVSEDNIRTYIKEIRRILPDGSIETCKGQGYRLV